MGIEVTTFLMVAAMVLLMLTGLPLAFVTGAVAVGTTLLAFGPNALPLLASRSYSLVNQFAFVAVPMFVLMASILERSGVAKDLFRAMHVWAGRMPGGLAVQTLFVAVLMAAMMGIIGGEIVLLGMIALPQMLRLNYQKNLAIGTICAGGSLGTMIPPSIVLIMYGLTANVSIGDLFLASIGPGLLLALLYLSYIVTLSLLKPEYAPPAPEEERNMPLKEKLRLLKGVILPLAVAAWVMISIYGGIASVSEAAGMGVLGAVVSAAIRRELTWELMRAALRQTMGTCGMLLWLTIGANALIGVFNLLGGTSFIQSSLAGLPLPPIGILLVLMAALIVLGMFMDWIGILLLTMPIFVPLIASLGFDPVWFGVLFCMNMQISYLTPPFGPAAFYLKGVAPPEISLGDIYNSLWPFIGMQVVAIMLVILFPEIALWLPQIVF